MRHQALLFKGALVALLIPFTLAYALATLDLNSASLEQLEQLPGVGKKIAEEIIAARPLKSVEDLKGLKGIGEGRYEKIKDLVTVQAAPELNPATTTSRRPEPTTATATTSNNRSKLAPGEKININTASMDDLDRLLGIGKVKAKAIIEGRPYQTLEDIMKVKGIKQATFNKIKNNITL
jgi:competence protein ComEA